MIKVMNIISDSNIGGAGRVLINYMKYCDRANFDVSVALPEGSDLIAPLRALDTRVIELKGIAEKSLSLGALKELKKTIRTEKPDIVHTHGSMAGRMAARECGALVIYTRHSAFPVPGYLKKGPGRLINKLVNEHYADRIIAVSPAAAQNLTDGGISAKLIDTMMNGVEPVTRSPQEVVDALRRDWSIDDGEFTAGIVARIEDYKGHDDILDAVKILRDEGRPIKLIVAGTGGYESEVKRRTDELGLTDSVVFLGFVQDVAPVLSALDVQLNASWGTETSSLSVLEGFSMSLPAIVSDYGGNPCLVDDGMNGLLFKTRDAKKLAGCLRKVMDDPALLKKMGENARDIYLERFTGESFARRVEAVYDKTVKESKHRGK